MTHPTDDELKDLAHSAYEEAMSFGLSVDTFLRYFKGIRNRALLAEQARTEPVPLPGELVIKALRAMDAEARKRGEMYPQTRDEQEADTKAVRNVIESLEFYTSGRQVGANGWPSVKDWPALPATAAQPLKAEQAKDAAEDAGK